jgi:Trp operon repressor
VLEAVVALAVDAPGGPPVTTADFLARLDPGWLALAYAAGGYEDQLALARSAARHVPEVALRYRTLFRRLGPGLDGPGSFADADAWYCILEGTAEISVAEAQARALVDLLATYVTQANAPRPRQVLLAVDEFSAVSRRLRVERETLLGVARSSRSLRHGNANAHANGFPGITAMRMPT